MQCLPALRRAVREAEPDVLVDRRDGRGTGERVAAERRRVRALRQVAEYPRERDRAHRDTPGDGLREAEDVGHDPVLLEREHRPGPAEPGLDLVDHEERATLAAQAGGLRDELLRRRTHPALALDELDD